MLWVHDHYKYSLFLSVWGTSYTESVLQTSDPDVQIRSQGLHDTPQPRDLGHV